jgi:chemotaxis protein MotA
MDVLSIIGVVIACGAIVVGQYLEGGHLGTLLNGPAILIVGGGTIGATMIQSSMSVFLRALRMAVWIFHPPVQSMSNALEKLLDWSRVARREGLLGLEVLVDNENDTFLQKGLQLLVDGSEPDAIRDTLEIEIAAREHRDFAAANVYQGMGGYAPTIGIIGAVMGLIHVMGNLADPNELGGGIAVAFVATIYGVGLANLFFLPTCNKLKSIVRRQTQFREMMTEGLVAIADGENPRIIEMRLQSFFD